MLFKEYMTLYFINKINASGSSMPVQRSIAVSVVFTNGSIWQERSTFNAFNTTNNVSKFIVNTISYNHILYLKGFGPENVHKLYPC
jgi:hypothetical protein